MTTIKVTGLEAIKVAEISDVVLCKYTDPTEEHREGLSVLEARDIAVEGDPSLIYVEAKSGTVVAELRAANYEDEDDCITAAVADVADRLGVETWQLAGAWGEGRNEIVVRVA